MSDDTQTERPRVLQASPIASALGLELQKGNRVGVGPELSVPDQSEVFAVGDENIARLVAGKDAERFKYHDKGTMATIGRGAAVVQMHNGPGRASRTTVPDGSQ